MLDGTGGEKKDTIRLHRGAGLAQWCCGWGSIPGPGVTCGLSLLWGLVLAPRVFLRVLRLSSLHKNQHSNFNLTYKQWKRTELTS